jgi:hypothetical protein
LVTAYRNTVTAVRNLKSGVGILVWHTYLWPVYEDTSVHRVAGRTEWALCQTDTETETKKK